MKLLNLAKIRAEKNLSREEVAAKVMLTERTIFNLENGKGTTTNNARRIAKALKCPLDELKGVEVG